MLAYGDLKRVELAMALANQPRLLLMDEPTAGMAPKERVALMELAAGLARARKIAVLFTEHDMDVVFSQADRIIVLDRGQLIAGGTPQEVRANPDVRAVYLGSGTDVLLGACHSVARRRSRAHERDGVRAPSNEEPHAPGKGPARLLRPRPHPARRVARGVGRRGRGPAGPQRRRQVDRR